MSQIFVSYRRSDKDFVRSLYDQLQSKHLPLWMDEHSIKPAEDWQEAIFRAIELNASALVVVLSPEAVESDWVGIEYNLALDKGLKVIPYIYKPCDIPARLKHLNYIEHRGSESIDKLAETLAEIVFDKSALQLINNKNMTFDAVARQSKGFLRIEIPKIGASLRGIPLGAYYGSLVYLVGRENDNLSPVSRVQLALQFANTYGSNRFIEQIAELFLVHDKELGDQLRILLVRGPLQLGKDIQTNATTANHGLDEQTPNYKKQWTGALNSIIEAKRLYESHITSIRHIQVFHQGPAMLLPVIPWPLEFRFMDDVEVGSSRVDLQACKLEYSIVSPK